MIYTVTPNPNIDYYMTPRGVPAIGAINRAAEESYFPGGKGVNVSILLARLGADTRATGFVAGYVGRMLEEMLAAEGCCSDFVRLPAGETRINLKLTGQYETAFNGRGPAVPPEAVEALEERLSWLTSADTLVLSGNLQADLTMASLLSAAGNSRLVVDTEGEALLSALPYEPFLVKPNREELSALLVKPLETETAILEGAKALQAQGAQNVLVSLGGDGALLLAKNGAVCRARANCGGQVLSTVGAGDSMVAGFLYGYDLDSSPETALRWGVAAGTATAFSPVLANRPAVEAVLKTVTIEMI